MTIEEVKQIISTVSYKPGFEFVVAPDYIQLRENTTCNYSGKPYVSSGRKWKWSEHMVKSEIVTTCLKAVLQYEEHEARENFKYQGESIFDPHYDIDKLLELRKSQNWADLRPEPIH